MWGHGSEEMVSTLKTFQIPLLQAESHGFEAFLLALMCQSALWVTKDFKQINSFGLWMTLVPDILKFGTVLSNELVESLSFLVSFRRLF